LTNSHQDLTESTATENSEYQESDSINAERISELFKYYADRVAQEFPRETLKKWHQPLEHPLTIADIIRCVEGMSTTATASDDRRDVALLESAAAIVKVVIVNRAAIFIDLGTRDAMQSEAMMAGIAEKLVARVQRGSRSETP